MVSKSGKSKPKTKIAKGKDKGMKKTKGPNQFIALGPKNMKGPFGRFDDVNPFPIRLPVRMVYVDELILGSTASANTVGTTHKFGINNLYDPNSQVGGHQPYGYDQLIASGGPYARYKVHGCKVTMTFTDPSVDTGLYCCMAVYDPVQTGAGETMSAKTIQRLKEQPNTVTRYVSNTGQQKVSVSQYFDIAKVAGLSKVQFLADSGNYTGAYNSSPGNICTVEVGVLDVRSSSPQTTIVCTVRLEYYCILYDRYTLSQS